MGESQITVQLDMSSSYAEMADTIMEAIAVPGDSLVHGAYSLVYVIEPWLTEMWRPINRALHQNEMNAAGIIAVQETLICQAWVQVVKDLFERDIRVIAKESV